jgi:hypothetical protein
MLKSPSTAASDGHLHVQEDGARAGQRLGDHGVEDGVVVPVMALAVADPFGLILRFRLVNAVSALSGPAARAGKA